MPLLTLPPTARPTVACRRCGAPLDLGAKASLLSSANVLLDCACATCGHRALYKATMT